MAAIELDPVEEGGSAGDQLAIERLREGIGGEGIGREGIGMAETGLAGAPGGLTSCGRGVEREA